MDTQAVWKGILACADGHDIEDIHLSNPAPNEQAIPSQARLRFLSLVDVSRIPLYLRVGPCLDVWTSYLETERRLDDLLLGDNKDDDGEEEAWWHTARLESPLGILAAVEAAEVTCTAVPRITEVLFFASQRSQSGTCPPTPPHSSPGDGVHRPRSGDGDEAEVSFELKAITLSSDLLYSPTNNLTPPSSPGAEEHGDYQARFLPSVYDEQSLAQIQSTGKRKAISATFDGAAEQRKRAKKNVGSSVAAAAATHQAPSVPVRPPSSASQQTQYEHQTEVSKRSRPPSRSAPVQTRPLSRSPSLSGSFGGSRRPSISDNEPAKRSNLSRVHSVTDADDSIEARNKDIISRLIMAGMRLHGLSQSKRSSTSRGQPQQSAQEVDEIRVKDEEYKLIYHQTLKATLLTVRTHVAMMPLQRHTEVLRDIVDQLLGMFCSDPLAAGLGDDNGANDKITPGGRLLFGSAAKGAESSPFAVAAGDVKVVKLTPELGTRRQWTLSTEDG